MSEDLAENMSKLFSLFVFDTRFEPHQGWRKHLAPIGEWLCRRNGPAWLVKACVQVEFDGLLERIQPAPLIDELMERWVVELRRLGDASYASLNQEEDGGE